MTTTKEVEIADADVPEMTEASSLGFRVGEWPMRVAIKTAKGDRRVFVAMSAKRSRDGEVEWVRYRTDDGLGMIVSND